MPPGVYLDPGRDEIVPPGISRDPGNDHCLAASGSRDLGCVTRRATRRRVSRRCRPPGPAPPRAAPRPRRWSSAYHQYMYRPDGAGPGGTAARASADRAARPCRSRRPGRGGEDRGATAEFAGVGQGVADREPQQGALEGAVTGADERSSHGQIVRIPPASLRIDGLLSYTDPTRVRAVLPETILTG